MLVLKRFNIIPNVFLLIFVERNSENIKLDRGEQRGATTFERKAAGIIDDDRRW